MDLMKGDCLELMKGIPDGSVDMVLCDLPYGTTQNKWDAIIPFADLWEQYVRVCKGAIVLTAAQPFTSALVMSNAKRFRYQWVWEKTKASGFLNARRRPLTAHEDIVVFGNIDTYNPQGLVAVEVNNARKNKAGSGNFGRVSDRPYIQKEGNFPRSVLRFQHETAPVHPTQKPIALMEYMVRTYTNEGETVLDNTMGSGTTGVACVNTGRKFIGIEMDDGYFEIAQKRIAGAIAAKDLEAAISLSLDASDKTA
jgi:site-specific DNA-methyltransferase (adenine-specific)